MTFDWQRLRIFFNRHKLFSYVGTLFFFGNIIVCGTYLHVNDLVSQREGEIAALEQDIQAATADLRAYADFKDQLPEIQQLASEDRLDLAHALTTIAPTAAALGLSAISYQVGEISNYRDNNLFGIDEIRIQLTIDCRDERQALAYLAELERQWGGRFDIRRMEITRLVSDEDVVTALKHEVSFVWLTLQKP